MKKEFFKLTTAYTIGIIVVFGFIWLLIEFAMPEAKLNILKAMSSAYGINLPDDVEVDSSLGVRAVAIVSVISVLSIAVLVINIFYGAVITSHFIRPRVKIITSSRGVLSTKWNPSMPYVLVRLSNFHSAELVDVHIDVVLTVEEKRTSADGEEDTFLCYLPVTDYTPTHVLVMRPKMPWSIAVPADVLLSSSLTKNYHFRPGEAIEHSFSRGKKPTYVKRSLEILVQGIDSKSYASFVYHCNIVIDEQVGDSYRLHLHEGTFKSLPLHIKSPEELEQYAS